MTFLYAHRSGHFKSEPTLSPQTIATNTQIDQATHQEDFHQQRHIPMLDHLREMRSTYFLERRLFY